MDEGTRQPGKAGRQPTDPKWRDRVFRVKANKETWGAGRIAKQLYADWPDEDAPSESVVRRMLKSPPANLAMLRYYSWPGAMLGGLLPWEAGAALLELLHRYQERGISRPPTVGRAQWFWRVTLACPDAPLARRDEFAGYLAAADLLPEDARTATYETVAGTIFYAHWKSEEHQQRYAEAIGRGEVNQLSVTLTPDTTIDEAVKVVDELTGAPPSGPRSIRSFFEALAEHPEMSPPEALDAQIKAQRAVRKEAKSKEGETQ